MTSDDKKSKGSYQSMRHSEPKKKPVASPHLPKWLEQGLQDLYRETLNEPLPKEFEDLLQQLDDAEKDKE